MVFCACGEWPYHCSKFESPRVASHSSDPRPCPPYDTLVCLVSRHCSFSSKSWKSKRERERERNKLRPQINLYLVCSVTLRSSLETDPSTTVPASASTCPLGFLCFIMSPMLTHTLINNNMDHHRTDFVVVLGLG